jgi:NADH:ubiquinone oxidoreductase subunit 6 (subunit J)
MLKYVAIPGVILIVGVAYLFLTAEPIGSVLLLIFAGAMGVMTWVLLPTLDNVGPTAPVDPDFEQPHR